jgi:hypothetical protein
MSAPPSGTSVETPRLSPRLLGAGAAIALSAVAVVAAVATSGGDDVARPAAAAEPPPPAAPEAVRRPPAAPLPLPQPAVARGAANQAAAIEQLRRAFAKARLYSQISVQGADLELRSAACEDAQLAALLAQSRTALTESGLRSVRCLQPHGQVVFSREL